jgi:hypothetical protein
MVLHLVRGIGVGEIEAHGALGAKTSISSRHIVIKLIQGDARSHGDEFGVTALFMGICGEVLFSKSFCLRSNIKTVCNK